MNEPLQMRVNTVRFLMNMFETTCNNSNQVATFKSSVDDLVRRKQITREIRDLVYGLYGIKNTNIYKPSVQAFKLMQVSLMIPQAEICVNENRPSDFILNTEDGVRDGFILKSARDFVFELFEFDSKSVNTTTNNNAQSKIEKKIDTKVPNPSKPNFAAEAWAKVHAEEVREELDCYKKEYWDKIYYEYPNPTYTGCTDSFPERYIKLIECTKKPNGAKVVARRDDLGDPCSPRTTFGEVPKEWKKSNPVPKVNTPSSSIGNPCMGGSWYRSSC